MQEYTIILIGKSGSGKGTQLKKMRDLLESRGETSIEELESGQNLRDFINADTYTSKLAKSNNVQGKLQPAFLAIWAWVNKMLETFAGQKIIFVDGAPRKLNEANILDEMFDFYNRQNRYVIHINITDQWARERLQERGRGDDLKEDSVKRRLDWFEQNAPGILSFFEKTGKYKVVTIHGEQDAEGVHKDIVSALGL
jgi:adenylate kinase family enzyme